MSKREREPAVLFTDEEWAELVDAVDSHAAKLETLTRESSVGWEVVRRRKALLAGFEKLIETRRKERR